MKTQTITPIEYFVHQNLVNSNLNSAENFIACHNLKSHLRNTDLVLLRYETMYRIRWLNKKLTLDKIGKMFDKDHSTVVAACKEVEKLRSVKDAPYLRMIEKYGKELDEVNFTI